MEKSTNNELRDKAFACAVKHGWHDKEYSLAHWLMMIITECSEAVQADRKGKRAFVNAYESDLDFALGTSKRCGTDCKVDTMEAFEENIKDSLEDELADICIRCYDLAGLIHIDIDLNMRLLMVAKSLDETVESYKNLGMTDFMYCVTALLTHREDNEKTIVFVLYMIAEWAAFHGIDIEYFIREKMRYNEMRPYKHNRKY